MFIKGLGFIIFLGFLYIMYRIWYKPFDVPYESNPRYKEFIDEDPENKE